MTSETFFTHDRPHFNLWDLYTTGIPEPPLGKEVALRCAMSPYTLKIENERLEAQTMEEYIEKKITEAQTHHIIQSQLLKEIASENEKIALLEQRKKETEDCLYALHEQQKRLHERSADEKDPFTQAIKAIFDKLENLSKERETLLKENARLEAATVKQWDATQEKLASNVIDKMKGKIKNARGEDILLSTNSKDPAVIQRVQENRAKLKKALKVTCPIKIMRVNPALITNLLHQNTGVNNQGQARAPIPVPVLKKQAAKILSNGCNVIQQLDVMACQANDNADPNESFVKRFFRISKNNIENPVSGMIQAAKEEIRELGTAAEKVVDKIEEKLDEAGNAIKQVATSVANSVENLFEAAVTCITNDTRLKEIDTEIIKINKDLNVAQLDQTAQNRYGK